MYKNLIKPRIYYLLYLIPALFIFSCGSFTYKTYDESLEETSDDPEPNYSITLNENFQDYTNYMFPGNRIENFVTFFNTFYNAKTDFEDAHEEYLKKMLENYAGRIDSALKSPVLSQETIDKFNKTIERSSKVIQYHKSSDFLDDAVLLIGQSYFYLGDNLKAERKFSEFISKLSMSPKYDEAILFLSKTQIRLGNYAQALERLEDLIKKTNDEYIKSESYRSLAEYYLSRKDQDKAIKNYKNSINYSNDDEFKAQMQYIIASIISKDNPASAAGEYLKVINYSPTFILEYLANYNYTRSLILSNSTANIPATIENLRVKYKDNPEYSPEIELLEAYYYYQKKDHVRALSKFKELIKLYPQTPSSSDAAYYIADYYENSNDYLNAFRFYRFSAEQSYLGHYNRLTTSKINTFKRYYDLSSVISGTTINTDYNDDILKLMNKEVLPGQEGYEEGDKIRGKGQGQGSKLNEDSVLIKNRTLSNAMFELAELFIYELKDLDSAEYYLKSAYEESMENDYKSKVLLALANLYTSMNNPDKYNETLRQIIELYPTSIAANESRKLLNLPIEDISFRTDAADSIYVFAAEKLDNNEYAVSLEAFQYIIKNHPTSVFIEKSYYATGWLYENIYNKYDSAFYYYSKLMELNPMNEYAGAIAGKIYEYKNASGSTEIPDTTKIENNNIPTNEPEKEIKDPVKDGTSEEGEMNVPDVNIKSIEEEKMRQQNEGDIEDNK